VCGCLKPAKKNDEPTSSPAALPPKEVVSGASGSAGVSGGSPPPTQNEPGPPDGAVGNSVAAGDGDGSAAVNPVDSGGVKEVRIEGGILKKKRGTKKYKLRKVDSQQEDQPRSTGGKQARLRSLADINVVLVSESEDEEGGEEDPGDTDSSEGSDRDPESKAKVVVAEIEFDEQDVKIADSMAPSKLAKMQKNKMRIKDSIAVSKFKKHDMVLGEHTKKGESVAIRSSDLSAVESWRLFEGQWILTRVENMNRVFRSSGYDVDEMSAWKEDNFGVGSNGLSISIPKKEHVTLSFETETLDYAQELEMDDSDQTVDSYWGEAPSKSRWLSSCSFSQNTKWKDADVLMTWTLLDSGNCLEQKFTLTNTTDGQAGSPTNEPPGDSFGLSPLIQANTTKKGDQMVGIQLYSLIRINEEEVPQQDAA